VWAVLVVPVGQASHSPRQGAPEGVPTGNTGPSTEAARRTRIVQRQTDMAEAPVVTPSPVVRQARSNRSRGRAAMSARAAVPAIAAARRIAATRVAMRLAAVVRAVREHPTVLPTAARSAAAQIASAAAIFPAAAAVTGAPSAVATTADRALVPPAVAAPRVWAVAVAVAEGGDDECLASETTIEDH
jgi:hypothetical protein